MPIEKSEQIVEIGKEIRIHNIDTEKFKTTILSILIRCELNRNNVTKNALLTEVLKKGCSRFPSSFEISKKTEELYGAVFDSYIIKKGEEQILCFYLECLRDCQDDPKLLQKGIHFLTQILTNPLADGDSFMDGIVEREKKTLEQKIKSRSDDKKEYAKIRCLDEMCKDEPFGIYADGYIEDLKNISASNLYSHYLVLLKQAPIEIVLTTGQQKQTEEQLKKVFSFTRESIKIPKKAEINSVNKKENVINEFMDINQGKLCIGFRTGIPSDGKDFYSMLVFNEIFGGGASSRLFLNVREKESLCYYINTFLYRFKMILFLQAGIDAKDKEKAKKLIKECLEEMKKNPVKKEELINAKLSLSQIYRNIEDYQAGYMDFSITQFLLNSKDRITDFIEQINQVTVEDVQKAAESVTLDTIYFLSSSQNKN